MENKLNIAVAIVTYNRKELLLETLDAIWGQSESVKKIFILDNNSTDSTDVFLKDNGYIDSLSESVKDVEKFDVKIEVVYKKSAENTGGAGGFNQVFSMALKSDFDYLWIMDDDVLPRPNCLELLVENRDKANVVVPLRVNKLDGIEETAGLTYNLKNPFLVNKNYRIKVMDKYLFAGQLNETTDIFDFSFEGPLIKREVIEKCGLPDEKLFILGDDTEYSQRIRYIAKENMILVRDAIITRQLPVHSSNWKFYYLYRNRTYIHLLYGENFFVKLRPALILILDFFHSLVTLRFNRKFFKVNFLGVLDGYRKKFHKRFLPNSKI